MEVVDLFDEDDDEELSRALEASRCEWEGLQKVSLQPRFEGEMVALFSIQGADDKLGQTLRTHSKE